MPPVFFNAFEPFGLRGLAEGHELAALADIDGDGDLDAFVRSTQEYEGLQFAENSGSATAPAFANPTAEWFGVSGLDAMPAIADWGGDGDLDLLVANGETLRVYENTGSATAPAFAPPLDDAFGVPGAWRIGPTFADIDGDADLDMLGPYRFAFFGHMLTFPNVGSAADPQFLFPLKPFGLTDDTNRRGALADLDGDGDLDYVTNVGYDALFHENTGAADQPAFAAAVVGAFGLTLEEESPVFADLDGDGDLDLFTSSYGNYHLSYRENTGEASAPAFAAATIGAFGLTYAYYADLAFGDLDGDGDLDLLLGSFYDTLYLANTGSPTAPAFAAPVTLALPLPDLPDDHMPALEDLDGDGDLDLVLSSYGYPNLVLENTGGTSSAAFAAPRIGPLGLESTFIEPVFGDLDGDGDVDALSTAFGMGALWFENVGTPTEPAFLSFVDRFGLFAGRDLSGPALGDLDFDGDLDAIARWDLDGTLTRYRNVGSPAAPAFVPDETIDGIPGGSNHLGDVDGDGDLDLIVGAGAPTLFVENRGTPEAAAFDSPIDPFGTDYEAIAIADLDGDGDLDAFTMRYDEEEEEYRPVLVENVGTPLRPSFAPGAAEPFGLDDPDLYHAAFVDLDADGDLDILTRGKGGFAFHQNTGSASIPAFAAPTIGPFGLPGTGYVGDPVPADLDGDGDFDLLTAQGDAQILFFENTGGATSPALASPVTNPFGLAGTDLAALAFGDLDGDGDLDALRGSYYGSVDFLENTGARTVPAFAPGVLSVEAPGYSRPVLADLDGDGDLDLYAEFGYGHTIEMPNLTNDPVCPAEPAPDCAGAFTKASLAIDERKRGKESLRIEGSRGPELPDGSLGDPTTAGGSAVAACLYDQDEELAGRLTVDRAGESCGRRPCWSATGSPGIAYADPAADEAGVRFLRFDGGKHARFKLLARNSTRKDQRSLPRGIAQALSSSATILLQVHVSDGACVSAELTPFKAKPGVLKAR